MLVAVAIGAPAIGCGPAAPDYQSIWSTTPTPSTTTTTDGAAPPIPFSQYLENKGVTGAPVAPDKLTDLTVTLPRPAGWEQYANANPAPGTRTSPRATPIRRR